MIQRCKWIQGKTSIFLKQKQKMISFSSKGKIMNWLVSATWQANMKVLQVQRCYGLKGCSFYKKYKKIVFIYLNQLKTRMTNKEFLFEREPIQNDEPITHTIS